MSLQHAILVMLDREPASGYDLTRRFERGIGNFWQASHQQIYQQLARLSEAGHVSFRVLAQSGRPDRKVYRLTAAGRRALQAWLVEPAKAPVVRDALLIKVFAAHLGDRDTLGTEIDRHLAAHRETLAAHRREEEAYFALDATRRDAQRLPYLTLRRGIRYEQEWIVWLEETRLALQSGRPPDAPVPAITSRPACQGGQGNVN